MKSFRVLLIVCLALVIAVSVSCKEDKTGDGTASDKTGNQIVTTVATAAQTTQTDTNAPTASTDKTPETDPAAGTTEKPVTEPPVTTTEKAPETEPAVTTTEPIVEPPIYIFDISSRSETMEVGETLTLTVSVSPEKTFDVTWTSSDSSVASVKDGVVTALKAGSAEIIAQVECNDLRCMITVNEKPAQVDPVTAAVSSKDAEGSLDLTAGSYTYWEHFGRGGEFTKMLCAKDIIDAGAVEALGNEFYDYHLAFTWTNGDPGRSYYSNTNGRFTESTFSFDVKLPKGTSEIVAYVGCWRATNTVSLVCDGRVIVTAEPFTAGDSSVNKEISFKVTCDQARTVTVVMDPSEAHDGGNISIAAILIPGKTSGASTKVSSLDKTLMTGNSDFHINLTEKGKLDWVYLGNFDEKNGADYFITDHTISNDTVSGRDFSVLVDYRASFGWSDGTNDQYAPADDDCDHYEIDGNEVGTNNGIFGSYVSAEVKVTSKVSHLYVYSTGWNAEYKIAIIDKNGRVLYYETVDQKADGDTRAYELDFTLSVKSDDTLTVVVYRLDGSNCGMAALALS